MPNIQVPDDEYQRVDYDFTTDKLADIAADSDWLDDAACADMNLSDFFTSIGHNPKLSTLLTCQRCPVKDDCLNSAAILENAKDHIGKPLSSRLPGHGVYAGLTPSQRAQVWILPKEAWARAADGLLEKSITQAANARQRDLDRSEKREQVKKDRRCFCGDPVYAELTQFCGQHLADAIRLSNEERKGVPYQDKKETSKGITEKVRAQSVKKPAKKVTRTPAQQRPCEAPGCDTGAKYFAKGFCTTHYFRQHKKKSK
jgi:hypothetical protein